MNIYKNKYGKHKFNKTLVNTNFSPPKTFSKSAIRLNLNSTYFLLQPTLPSGTNIQWNSQRREQRQQGRQRLGRAPGLEKLLSDSPCEASTALSRERALPPSNFCNQANTAKRDRRRDALCRHQQAAHPPLRSTASARRRLAALGGARPGRRQPTAACPPREQLQKSPRCSSPLPLSNFTLFKFISVAYL